MNKQEILTTGNTRAHGEGLNNLCPVPSVFPVINHLAHASENAVKRNYETNEKIEIVSFVS